jgi:hypothetical protein
MHAARQNALAEEDAGCFDGASRRHLIQAGAGRILSSVCIRLGLLVCVSEQTRWEDLRIVKLRVEALCLCGGKQR